VLERDLQRREESDKIEIVSVGRTGVTQWHVNILLFCVQKGSPQFYSIKSYHAILPRNNCKIGSTSAATDASRSTWKTLRPRGPHRTDSAAA
jgi:hypothetical protein